MAYVRVVPDENRTGDRVKFRITHLDGSPYAVRIRYRVHSTLPWSATPLHTSPAVDDIITVDGLTDGVLYEFYPVAVAEDGTEDLPGNIVRLCVSSADVVTQIRDAIVSVLTYFLPQQNIRYSSRQANSPYDTHFPLATVTYLSTKTERLLNCCVFRVHRFGIFLRQEGLSDVARQEILNRQLEEIVRSFESDITPFAAIAGYYDTKVVEVRTKGEDRGEPAATTASVILEAWVRK